MAKKNNSNTFFDDEKVDFDSMFDKEDIETWGVEFSDKMIADLPMHGK